MTTLELEAIVSYVAVGLLVHRALRLRWWPVARALGRRGRNIGIVSYCARCFCPVMGDPEMRRRSARRCSTVTYCDGPCRFVIDPSKPATPGNVVDTCHHATLVWS